MTLTIPTVSTAAKTKRVGRWLLIAVAALALCSCRGLDPQLQHPLASNPVGSAAEEGPSMESHPAVIPAAHTQDGAIEKGASQSLSDVPAVAQVPAVVYDPRVASVASATPVAPAVWPPHYRTGAPGCPPTVPQAMVQVGPPCPPGYPPAACGPETRCPPGVSCGCWTPPGLECPWPIDEYICDGGDKTPSVKVRPDWSVDGLALEDTVVHYDTVNGQTHIEPSNRVCIYAPRFAAVRKVYGIVQHDYHERIARVDKPVPIEGLGDVQIATTTIQPVQPGLNLGTQGPSGIRENIPPTGLENSEGLIGTQGGLLPYFFANTIHDGQMDASEKARLAERIEAAIAWSHDTAVQVLIDDIATHEDIGVTEAQAVHIYSLDGKPRLQVCKIASGKEARPGEIVEFAIRFDNAGDQVIGNVTVIDNLTTRLEYVDGSQSCTLKANFSSSENQGDSLTLRWEIVEPMKVGEGGVIRFQCRVR